MSESDEFWLRIAIDDAKKKFQNAALSHGLCIEGSEIKSAKEDVEMLRSHALFTNFSEKWCRYALRVKLLASVQIVIPLVFSIGSYLTGYEVDGIAMTLLLVVLFFGVILLYLISRVELYFGSWLGVPDPTWRKPFHHIWKFIPPRWEGKKL